MANAVRWSEEQLVEYQRKQSGAAVVPATIHAPVKESKLERRFDQQLLDSGLPEARKNYFFLDGRDFELDRAWPEKKAAVEIQGMAHRIKGKWKRDIEKRALALLAGWRVLEVDGASIRDGRAIEWTKLLLS